MNYVQCRFSRFSRRVLLPPFTGGPALVGEAGVVGGGLWKLPVSFLPGPGQGSLAAPDPGPWIRSLFPSTAWTDFSGHELRSAAYWEWRIQVSAHPPEGLQLCKQTRNTSNFRKRTSWILGKASALISAIFSVSCQNPMSFLTRNSGPFRERTRTLDLQFIAHITSVHGLLGCVNVSIWACVQILIQSWTFLIIDHEMWQNRSTGVSH